MLSFIWWLIIGLIVGALARLIMPGRDAMGMIATLVLGILGSILEAWSVGQFGDSRSRVFNRRVLSYHSWAQSYFCLFGVRINHAPPSDKVKAGRVDFSQAAIRLD